MTHPQGDGIEAPKASVERLCAAARVSRASYYRDWAERSPRAEDMEVRHRVQLTSLANPKYGSRRITALLRREGPPVNHKRVERIRKEDNLLCLRKRTFRPATTNSRHGWIVWRNLARDMNPTAVNQLWVADITYVRLAEAFVFLAVILDAYSRRVVGWAMADHLRAELALEALEMALKRRKVVRGELVHHSDRGIQYACGDYIGRLEAEAIRPSMSKPGCPYDNAQAESFMATLKREEVNGRHYRDLEHAKKQIGQFIETVYNRQRLHSALGYRSPEEFEAGRTNLSTPLWTAFPRPTATTTAVP
jgi:transposase InsO family protein